MVLIGVVVIGAVVFSGGEKDLKFDENLEIDLDLRDYEKITDDLDAGLGGGLNRNLKPGEIDVDLGEVEGGDIEDL